MNTILPAQFVQIQDFAPRCVDGRLTQALAIPLSGGGYKLWRGKVLDSKLGPQLLGGSLGFIAAVETVGGLDDQQAFSLVEEAHRQLEWEPQFHIDSHHFLDDLDDKKILQMSDEDLLQLMLHTNLGCGFADYHFTGYHYQDQADKYISMARERRWRIQLLIGNHQEAMASINYQPSKTFETNTAVVDKKFQPAFNQDQAAIRPMLRKIEEISTIDNLATAMDEWLIQTYAEVVRVLTSGKVVKSDIQIFE